MWAFLSHQIDVAAVLVGGEQLLNDIPDAAHEALLAASRRVGVWSEGKIQLVPDTYV